MLIYDFNNNCWAAGDPGDARYSPLWRGGYEISCGTKQEIKINRRFKRTNLAITINKELEMQSIEHRTRRRGNNRLIANRLVCVGIVVVVVSSS